MDKSILHQMKMFLNFSCLVVPVHWEFFSHSLFLSEWLSGLSQKLLHNYTNSPRVFIIF